MCRPNYFGTEEIQSIYKQIQMVGFQVFLCFAGLFHNFVDIHFSTIIHPVLFLIRALPLTLSVYCKLSSNCQNYFTLHFSLFPLNVGNLNASAFSSAYMHTDFFSLFLAIKNRFWPSFQKTLYQTLEQLQLYI